MGADLFGKLIKILRFVNSKTLKLKVFTYPHLLRVKIQVLLFFVSPALSRILSLKENKLPSNDQKFNKSNDLLDDVVIFDNDLKFDEVNIFLRGYGKDFTKFKYKKNCMLVNYSFLEDDKLLEGQHYFSKRNLYQGPDGFLNIVSGPDIDKCIKKNIPFIVLQRYQLCNDKPILIGSKNIELSTLLVVH